MPTNQGSISVLLTAQKLAREVSNRLNREDNYYQMLQFEVARYLLIEVRKVLPVDPNSISVPINVNSKEFNLILNPSLGKFYIQDATEGFCIEYSNEIGIGLDNLVECINQLKNYLNSLDIKN